MVDIDKLLEKAPVQDDSNLKSLAKMCGSDDVVTQILDVFFEDLPGQLTELAEAVGGTDPELTKRRAHNIKSAVANVGATAMQLVSNEIEKAAGRGERDAVKSLYDRLLVEFDKLKGHCGR